MAKSATQYAATWQANAFTRSCCAPGRSDTVTVTRLTNRKMAPNAQAQAMARLIGRACGSNGRGGGGCDGMAGGGKVISP